jgi:hypothetical protein
MPEEPCQLLNHPDLGYRQPSVLMDRVLPLWPKDVQPKRLFLALSSCPWI